MRGPEERDQILVTKGNLLWILDQCQIFFSIRNNRHKVKICDVAQQRVNRF